VWCTRLLQYAHLLSSLRKWFFIKLNFATPVCFVTHPFHIYTEQITKSDLRINTILKKGRQKYSWLLYCHISETQGRLHPTDSSYVQHQIQIYIELIAQEYFLRSIEDDHSTYVRCSIALSPNHYRLLQHTNIGCWITISVKHRRLLQPKNQLVAQKHYLQNTTDHNKTIIWLLTNTIYKTILRIATQTSWLLNNNTSKTLQTITTQPFGCSITLSSKHYSVLQHKTSWLLNNSTSKTLQTITTNNQLALTLKLLTKLSILKGVSWTLVVTAPRLIFLLCFYPVLHQNSNTTVSYTTVSIFHILSNS
jgi:hypothetical protein